MRCSRNRSNGTPCQAQAITGTDACRVHAGRPLAEQKAKGAVVMEVRRWGLDDRAEDPGLLLLKLMTVTEWNRQAYEAEIDRILSESHTSLSEALVGDTMVVDKDGSPHKVGEYIRGIVQMERQERELAMGIAVKAVAANLADRQLRLAETQAVQVVQVMRESLTELARMLAAGEIATVDPSEPAVTRVVATRLRALSAP